MQDAITVVTGGSRGIGAAIAARLAAAGSRVCLTYLTHESGARSLAGQLSATKGQVVALRADVARESDVVALFAEVDRTLGRVTALVNNAGVIGMERRIEDAQAADVAALFATNVTGALLCSREAIRRMAPRHGGRGGAIVNVSSMAGMRGGSETRVAYGASKGAINAFTQGLAREVAADKIRVNAVVPGYVDTEVHHEGDRPQRLQKAVQAVPMKRAGRPEEVADAVAWLLSEQASFVTGALIPVAGGA